MKNRMVMAVISMTILLAVLISQCAFAADYNVIHEPINMLGIPFTCRLADAKRIAEEQLGIRLDVEDWSDIGGAASVGEIICHDGLAYDQSLNGIAVKCTSYYPEVNVAGHEVSQVMLYCAKDFENSYTLDDDVDNAIYYAGTYVFLCQDADALRKDMYAKLTSVYGQDSGVTSKGIYNSFVKRESIWSSNPCKEEYALWESDANDAWLVLKSQDYEDDSSFESDNVQIMYIWKHADSFLKQVGKVYSNSLYVAEASKYSNSDTSGL